MDMTDVVILTAITISMVFCIGLLSTIQNVNACVSMDHVTFWKLYENRMTSEHDFMLFVSNMSKTKDELQSLKYSNAEFDPKCNGGFGSYDNYINAIDKLKDSLYKEQEEVAYKTFGDIRPYTNR